MQHNCLMFTALLTVLLMNKHKYYTNLVVGQAH